MWTKEKPAPNFPPESAVASHHNVNIKKNKYERYQVPGVKKYFAVQARKSGGQSVSM
jgi:hypothetical protein